MTGETVLILANAEWDWANRVNCHHLALRLARENQVVFVDTIGGRTPAPREIRKIARRLKRITGGVRQISPGLRVLAPFVLPVYGSELFRRLNTFLLAMQIRRTMPTRGRPILWLFLPSLVGLVGKFDEKLVIYHCIDQHAANPNVPARQVNEWEQELLNWADAVFASSSTLYEAKRALNANTYYLPNVADADHFAQARAEALPIASDMQDIRHPIAGFVGNITRYKVDLDLIAEVARVKPDWSFVLIGPVGRGDPSTRVMELEKQENVHLLGERPYADLPQYVKAFDVCLIPYRQNESTYGSLPMKFFEYLAAGKPVVGTDLETLKEFRELYYPVHHANEFAKALTACLNEDPSRSQQRVQAAEQHSWDMRMSEIDKILATIPHRATSAKKGTSDWLQRAIKRGIDIVASALGMLLLTPVFIVVAIVVRLSSGSPVLYEWNVIGQNGKPFKGYKFRTMVAGADQLKAQLTDRNEMRGPVFKLKDDPRITSVGRVLRKHSLDELPQFWSVLKGDMSFVGPRPPLAYEYERFTSEQRRKLAIKPGMTSLWQVSGKPSDFDEWVKLDLEYIDRWSLWLDFKILVKTAGIVISGKNY